MTTDDGDGDAMTKKNYPLRDSNDAPIGSSDDSVTNRLLTEAAPADSSVWTTTPAEGAGWPAGTRSLESSILDDVLLELRKLNKYMALVTGVEITERDL